MNVRRVLFASMAALACAVPLANASAAGLTRAEVRQQLIAAEAGGSQFVTDASYPEVSPALARQVAPRHPGADGAGPAMSGTSASGAPRTSVSSCVGPTDFCVPYFGS